MVRLLMRSFTVKLLKVYNSQMALAFSSLFKYLDSPLASKQAQYAGNALGILDGFVMLA